MFLILTFTPHLQKYVCILADSFRNSRCCVMFAPHLCLYVSAPANMCRMCMFRSNWQRAEQPCRRRQGSAVNWRRERTVLYSLGFFRIELLPLTNNADVKVGLFVSPPSWQSLTYCIVVLTRPDLIHTPTDRKLCQVCDQYVRIRQDVSRKKTFSCCFVCSLRPSLSFYSF